MLSERVPLPGYAPLRLGGRAGDEAAGGSASEGGRAAAVGRTSVARSEMEEVKKGSCVKKLHHAGEKFWNAYKKI